VVLDLLELTDPGEATLATVTVAISAGTYQVGEDFLDYPGDTTFVSGSFTAGVLTLSNTGGPATVLQYETALKLVTYENTSLTPDTTTRPVTFTVNDGINVDVTDTRNITVTEVLLTLTDTPTVSMLSADQILMEMPSQEILPTAFNLYRGNLSVLLSSGLYTQPVGQGPDVAQFCQITETTHTDAYQPQSGDVVFYLATAMTAAGEGVLGADSGGAERPHANACP